MLDDPLWDFMGSFGKEQRKLVLIPLLLDDPLWVMTFVSNTSLKKLVLIPLLLDDPLWGGWMKFRNYLDKSLNPSFAG